MTALDQGIPQRSAAVDVQVNVLRNAHGPVFRPEPYEVNINERFAYGTVVVNVTADDLDFMEQAGVSGVRPLFYLQVRTRCGLL